MESGQEGGFLAVFFRIEKFVGLLEDGGYIRSARTKSDTETDLIGVIGLDIMRLESLLNFLGKLQVQIEH